MAIRHDLLFPRHRRRDAGQLSDGSEQKFAGTLTELTRVLNLLGRDGWEIVTVSGETPIWTLKRAL